MAKKKGERQGEGRGQDQSQRRQRSVKAAGDVTVSTRRVSPRDRAVTLKMSPQEYELISYAASKSRARGIQMWMRERLLEAAREKVPEKTAENIIEGRATADLLRESLKEPRTGRATGRVLAFGVRGKQDQE